MNFLIKDDDTITKNTKIGFESIEILSKGNNKIKIPSKINIDHMYIYLRDI